MLRSPPRPPLRNYDFLTSCVECEDVDALSQMIEDAEQLTYRTFRKHLGPQLLVWAREKGYDRDLPLQRDWHVTYYRSTFGSDPCLFLCWSAIEFIWILRKPATTLPHN